MGPVASRSLFFAVQVLTLLSEKHTLFAHANLCYPTTRLREYLQQYLQHTYVCIHIQWDVREALKAKMHIDKIPWITNIKQIVRITTKILLMNHGHLQLRLLRKTQPQKQKQLQTETPTTTEVVTTTETPTTSDAVTTTETPTTTEVVTTTETPTTTEVVTTTETPTTTEVCDYY